MSGRSSSGTELGGLAVATMFSGSPTQLVQWCNIHLNRGADRLYVLLDRPSTELVAALPEDSRVCWEVLLHRAWERFYAPGRDNVERKQVDAIRWIARRAEAEGHRYLAFVDADEVLDFAAPFAEVAEHFPGASALRVPVREMWYDGSPRPEEPFGATLALRAPLRRIDWLATFGWRAQYLRDGMLGHDSGKTIYRLPLASGAFSVHGPLSGTLLARGETLSDETGRLLHYDSGSLASWNAKWGARLDGSVVAGGLGPHRRAQLRLFDDALRRPPQEQQRFYEEFFSIAPASLAALREADAVADVDLGPLVNAPLPVSASTARQPVTQLSPRAARVDYQFAMVCDRGFVKPTFATMISVLSRIEPNRSVRFVVLGVGLLAADVHFLRSLEHTRYDVEVQIDDVTEDLNRDLGSARAVGSRAAYAWAYLVDFLPEQRTIYLEGDVLATRDITELFELDMGDACIAGVPDSAALLLTAGSDGVPVAQRMRVVGICGESPLEYLDPGVLVLNVDHRDFRELALLTRAYLTMEGRALAGRDQDAINLAFAGRKHRLPSRYNYMTDLYTSELCLGIELASLKDGGADASLIQFSGSIKPWLANEDEFYNGLYRRLVSDAEEKVQVSCGLYFSRRSHDRAHWSSERWAEQFEASPRGAPVISARTVDIELVDLTESALYVRFDPDAYRHAVEHGLRLVARTQGAHLFTVPLDRLGPQQIHLSRRVGPAVRTAPLDLGAALAGHGGVARHIELVLASPEGDEVGFERSLGMIDVLASGTHATPALLGELGIEGAVEELAEGWLNGWYRTAGGEPVSLHIGDELVAQRVSPLRDDGTREIRFRAAHIVGLGYGDRDDELTVRVGGTNVPIPGLTPTVSDVRAARARGSAEPSSRLLARVRRRLAKIRYGSGSRLRGSSGGVSID